MVAGTSTVSVPVDRADPGLGTTSVAFALVPRRDAARPSLGTIVGPGGPGSFLIDRASQVVDPFAPLMNRRDLLLVDPRGTGRSGRYLVSSSLSLCSSATRSWLG